VLQPARPATAAATRSPALAGLDWRRHSGHGAASSSPASPARQAACPQCRRTRTRTPARSALTPVFTVSVVRPAPDAHWEGRVTAAPLWTSCGCQRTPSSCPVSFWKALRGPVSHSQLRPRLGAVQASWRGYLGRKDFPCIVPPPDRALLRPRRGLLQATGYRRTTATSWFLGRTVSCCGQFSASARQASADVILRVDSDIRSGAVPLVAA
jgi:hypothetical protein